MTEREIKSNEIKSAFNAMMAALECLLQVNSTVNSLCVSGAPGIGKTFNLNKRLQQAHDSLEWNVNSISGKMTTMALYETLYNNRHNTSVLVLDDMDSVFDSEDSLNLLKGALDTGKRNISYMTSSKYLKDNGIPNTFEMKGKVIFITNKNMSILSKGQSKMAPHYAAFMTRSVYVDLKIHNNTDIMIHIENVMRQSNILTKFNVSNEGSNMILNWMLKNEMTLRTPSLRTPVLMAGLYNSNPFDWEEMCDNLFLEK